MCVCVYCFSHVRHNNMQHLCVLKELLEFGRGTPTPLQMCIKVGIYFTLLLCRYSNH